MTPTLAAVSDRASALRVLALLRRTSIGDEAVLVGSSGLFGFETTVPALTEDIDLAIPEGVAAAHGDEVVSAHAESYSGPPAQRSPARLF